VRVGNPGIIETIRRLAETGPDLPSFAAEDAVETLIENWKAALRDDGDLRALIADLDGVVDHLRSFREKILDLYPAARPDPGPGPGPESETTALAAEPAG
jgi:tRNA-dihydrouridine synthase